MGTKIKVQYVGLPTVVCRGWKLQRTEGPNQIVMDKTPNMEHSFEPEQCIHFLKRWRLLALVLVMPEYGIENNSK